uniref:Uncharacterized protein n=1 Tax=Mus musculus TaxID=10090 RepID=Q3V3P0_MOUSE|nr:unnamed protein product [Mus musculus]
MNALCPTETCTLSHYARPLSATLTLSIPFTLDAQPIASTTIYHRLLFISGRKASSRLPLLCCRKASASWRSLLSAVSTSLPSSAPLRTFLRKRSVSPLSY